MAFTQQQEGEVLIIGLQERVDTNTSPDVEKGLMALIDAGQRHFVFDCSGLDYISSIGLRVFILASKKLKDVNGQIAFASMKGHIKEIFEIAGFATIFQIYDTKEEALAQF